MYRYKVKNGAGAVVPGVGVADENGYIDSPIELAGPQFELAGETSADTDNKVVGTQVRQPNMVTDASPNVNGEVM
jgi:hypothetical protein